jgi:hypothetical protein
MMYIDDLRQMAMHVCLGYVAASQLVHKHKQLDGGGLLACMIGE